MPCEERCPKCGAPNIYVGATRIECGYFIECENYSAKQEEEVIKILDAEETAAANEEQLDLWDDETDPAWLPDLSLSSD
jgi:hypothetical protein